MKKEDPKRSFTPNKVINEEDEKNILAKMDGRHLKRRKLKPLFPRIVSVISMGPALVLILIVLVGCETGFLNRGENAERTEGKPKVTDQEKTAEEVVPKEKEDVPTEEVLSREQIREVMENYNKIEGIIKGIEFSYFDGDALKSTDSITEEVLSLLPEDLSDIASKNMIENELPKNIKPWIISNGENGLFPEVYFDARMKVLENTPTKVKVKTFQLAVESSYYYGLNVFVTAIKEDGKWVIDSYETTSSLENEPINMTKDEYHTYMEHREGAGGIEFIAEETALDPLTNKESKVNVIKSMNSGYKMAHFADTGYISGEVLAKYE
ncbi:hypothetical protein [Neobacillus sp. LXY-4]|uniref:hypothetical protein n=1 Tax=Neobacillus sp. LXY-4 TaxID=3379826 RepID=UPI003EE305FD